MVRFGLDDGDSSSTGSSDGESVSQRRRSSGRFCAPVDDDDDDVAAPQSGGRRRSSASGAPSPGADGARGGRESLGLAAQLRLGGDAVAATRNALLGARRSSASPRKQAHARPVSDADSPRRQKKTSLKYRAHRLPAAAAPVPLAESACARMEAAALARLPGLRQRPCNAAARARSFSVAMSADGRIARPSADGFCVVISSAPLSDEATPDALRPLDVALAHYRPTGARPAGSARTAAALELPRASSLLGDRTAAAALARCVSHYAAATAGDAHMSTLWHLVAALWSETDVVVAADDSNDGADRAFPPTASSAVSSRGAASAAFAAVRRRNAVKDWLAAAVSAGAPAAGPEARGSLGLYRGVFELLTQRRVDEAAAACLAAGETRLALLISSCDAPESRSALEREFAAAQAAVRSAEDALRARIVGVAAGALALEDDIESSLLKSSNRAAIDWEKRLGLHVWYEHGDSVAAALESYDAAVIARCCAPPVARGSRSGARAAEYRLLQLGCAADGYSHPRETARDIAGAALDEAALGRRTGDAALGWHLHGVLDAHGALGPLDAARAAREATRLADALAYECVRRSHWEWAVFVVLASYSDSAARDRAVRDILDRHAHCDAALTRAAAGGAADDAMDVDAASAAPAVRFAAPALSARDRAAVAGYERRRAFCTDRLGVHAQWLDAALALRAGVAGPPHAYAALLVASEQWRCAERAMLRDAVPRALLGGRAVVEGLLAPLFRVVEPHRAGEADWRAGGGLHVDFAKFRTSLADLLADVQGAPAADGDAQAERLAALTRALGADARDLRRRLEALPPAATAPALAASGAAAHVPHLDAACRVDMATELATAQIHLETLYAAPVAPRDTPTAPTSLGLLADISHSTLVTPDARLGQLQDLAAALFE
ncbi:nuclear protein 96-domain-containing protein [Pelagophyceae sp. CCMP2097]|nr:nuclear protein 96-domain-containing protein [Pelagophyceae sp. CCMP2097]